MKTQQFLGYNSINFKDYTNTIDRPVKEPGSADGKVEIEEPVWRERVFDEDTEDEPQQEEEDLDEDLEDEEDLDEDDEE